MIMWQDVLDAFVSNRMDMASCPYCKNRPLTVEPAEYTTRILCGKCKKFIEGKFQP